MPLIWSSVSTWRGRVFMVFDWKSDRNEDVWEIERRISIDESPRVARSPDEARGNRASPWRSPLTSGSLQRRKFLNSCGADVFNPKRQQILTGASPVPVAPPPP